MIVNSRTTAIPHHNFKPPGLGIFWFSKEAYITKGMKAISKAGEIEGFIAVSFSTSKLYKEFILKRSLSVLPYLISRIFSIEFIRKIFEVLVYPVKSDSLHLPDTEIEQKPTIIEQFAYSDTWKNGTVSYEK